MVVDIIMVKVMVMVIAAEIFIIIIIVVIMVEFKEHIDINWVIIIIMEDIKVIEVFNNQEFNNLVKYFYFINYL